MTYTFDPIGVVQSPYKEKFGIPRQPGLVDAALGYIKLLPPYDIPDSLDGLQTSSHIWLQFVFHQNLDTQWRPKVRPPRLGGNKSMGVFATRSPVRPNPIGLSVVKFEGIDLSNGVRIAISGMDLLDGTPVLDIKPYVPYVDSVAMATNDFAAQEPSLLPVLLAASVQSQCQAYSRSSSIDLKALLIQVLQQDPRPAYQRTKIDPMREYGMKLLEFDVKWRYVEQQSGSGACSQLVEVFDLIKL